MFYGKGTGIDVGLKTFMSDLEQWVAFRCLSLHVFLHTVMLTGPPHNIGVCKYLELYFMSSFKNRKQ